MKQFDEIFAEFRPLLKDDLIPGAVDAIGATCFWQASWIIEAGPYKGDWAMMPVRRDLPFAWVPLQDLKILEEK